MKRIRGNDLFFGGGSLFLLRLIFFYTVSERKMAMKRLVLVGIAASAVLLSGNTLALESRKGLELEGRLGPNVCVERDGGGCSATAWDLKPGFGGGGYIGLRPLSFLSLGLDFGMYSLTPEPNDNDTKLRTSQAMLNFRIYIPFNLIEPFAKLGVGYLSVVQSNEDYKYRFYCFGNFKLGGGLTLYLIDSQKIGNIGLGADLDFALINPTKYKFCDGDTCESGDIDDSGSDSDTPYAMQLNLHFKWIIPIF